MDAVYILVIIAFFALSWLFVVIIDKARS